jgi:hypothetical protein
MSNSLAIAAVTSTLRKLLDDGVRLLDDGVTQDPEFSDLFVKTLPPFKVRSTGSDTEDNSGNLINIFLYQTAINAAFRNTDMPGQVRSGETGKPPLALNLYYLITAYGKDDDEVLSHRLLGRAMRILYDYPLLIKSDLLSEGEIKALFSDSGLDSQLEYIRITLQPMSLDEMSKLWMIFQTQYRASAAYLVEVVLIESTSRTRTPLPVLRYRAIVQPNLTPPFPILESLILPAMQPAIRLDDDLTIRGHHLDGDAVIRFRNPRQSEHLQKEFPGNQEQEFKFKLLDVAAANKWVAGFYTVAVSIVDTAEPDRTVTTNELPIALAPRITTALPMDVDRSNGNATVTLECSPQVLPEQRAALLLGDREILARPHPSNTGSLTFDVKPADPGKYFVRLRIDGVDSLWIQTNMEATPPAHTFDQIQTINIKE